MNRSEIFSKLKNLLYHETDYDFFICRNCILIGKITEEQKKCFFKSFELTEIENDFNIEDINITTRAKNVLKKLGIKNISDLGKLTKWDLLTTENCGKKTMAEILNVMAKNNIDLIKFSNFQPDV